MSIWQPETGKTSLFISDSTIGLITPAIWIHHLIRMTIRDNCDYASVGEFDWRHVTSSDGYRHACFNSSSDYRQSGYALCDKVISGVSYKSDLVMCPHCLNEIKTLNSGFVPEFNSDWAWENGFTQIAIELTAMNNQAYAKWIRE